MKRILLNLALFQIGWLVCVIGGNLAAAAFTVVALSLHSWLLLGSRSEWRLMATVVVVGCLWDIAMVRSGVISYADASVIGIPLWLICLWLLFATTFMHSLLWLRQKLWLAAVFAALMGPASYWVGSNLTEAQLAQPILVSLAIMAAGWALLFPCGIYYAGKLKT